MANKIRITVGGINYSIVSDESEEYLKELGAGLELRMNYFAKKNPFLSTTMTAVLAALEGYDNAKKAKAENEKLKSEINRLIAEIAVLKSNSNEKYAVSQSFLDEALDEADE
ncbi:MAG: cell division protein ZapA [Clostridia bacterium]|nr:cell division protein ZapA [Clostridia bacterium]